MIENLLLLLVHVRDSCIYGGTIMLVINRDQSSRVVRCSALSAVGVFICRLFVVGRTAWLNQG